MKEKFYAWCLAFVHAMAVLYTPVIYLMITVVLFMVLDFIAAVAADIKSGHGFSWTQLINSIPKGMIYIVAVFAAYYVEVHWLHETNLGKLICGVVVLREMRSINKHSKIVLGQDILSIAINAMKNPKR